MPERLEPTPPPDALLPEPPQPKEEWTPPLLTTLEVRHDTALFSGSGADGGLATGI